MLCQTGKHREFVDKHGQSMVEGRTSVFSQRHGDSVNAGLMDVFHYEEYRAVVACAFFTWLIVFVVVVTTSNSRLLMHTLSSSILPRPDMAGICNRCR